MKTVLITGVSSGIGEAAAQHFLSRGWRVVATARKLETLGAWSRSENVISLPLDVTSSDSVRGAIADVLQRLGALDVLVNNAGIGLAGPLEAIPLSDMEQHFQTNFFGAVRVIQEVMPVFREQKHGVIINVSSVAGRFGVPFLSPYCAGKFAIEGLSESLYYELRPFNIRIKLVEPGGIKTKFRQVFVQDRAYEPGLGAVSRRMDQASAADSKLPEPESVAKTIFTAANDGSEKLRYPIETQGASSLSRILPERAWRGIIRKSFGLS
ncbi:SDR family oxidoreductase [Granulicella sp. WH15]|uniref:SDR family oxidoreductase n=1 Tax=Granulicella sp. WH15 TaxID=2602070 RepID=UPI001366E008|nr:SDR family oxidoreductase [Granulicella sp. WH15]QHN03499.1 SDR family oxidoreductase [Granulicella sp. WH15]